MFAIQFILIPVFARFIGNTWRAYVGAMKTSTPNAVELAYAAWLTEE